MSTTTARSELIDLASYRRSVLSRVVPLEPITVGLLEAHGCVLAEDVDAAVDVPSLANSAMDGYALRASDTAEHATLRLVDEIAAGAVGQRRVGEGEAVRIMTGAPIPGGADAIVPFELATEESEHVRVQLRVEPGRHVRPAGEDVRAGERVLRAGTVLGAAEVGMLAALGHARVVVHPRPRVSVVSTGDEIVDPSRPAPPGAVRDANGYALTAALREAGAVAMHLGVVPDDQRRLEDAFTDALAAADMVVTSGGVSAGRYDFVKSVLAGMGDVAFTKVGMQPGMPQAFGLLSGSGGAVVPCFGLPGNPVSALVSFEVFVRPSIRRLQGREDLNRARVRAVLDESVSSPDGKVSFLRVRLHQEYGTWHATPTGPQGSGILRSMVEADGLAEVPAPPDQGRCRRAAGGAPPGGRIVTSGEPLTHLDDAGHARMVDVGGKETSAREAHARARVRMRPETARSLAAGRLPKGDAAAAARLAGIMAAKRTWELIPLCHQVALTKVEVDVEVEVETGLATIDARAAAADRTGVEMEALVAASTAALTIYDMVKAVERGVVIERVALEEKTGGARGDWSRQG